MHRQAGTHTKRSSKRRCCTGHTVRSRSQCTHTQFRWWHLWGCTHRRTPWLHRRQGSVCCSQSLLCRQSRQASGMSMGTVSRTRQECCSSESFSGTAARAECQQPCPGGQAVTGNEGSTWCSSWDTRSRRMCLTWHMHGRDSCSQEGLGRFPFRHGTEDVKAIQCLSRGMVSCSDAGRRTTCWCHRKHMCGVHCMHSHELR